MGRILPLPEKCGRNLLVSSHAGTRLPIAAVTRYKALPFYPPELHRDDVLHILSKRRKQEPPDRMAPTYVSALCIPTLALSKSGHRSWVVPNSQPVTQAPVYDSIPYHLYTLGGDLSRDTQLAGRRGRRPPSPSLKRFIPKSACGKTTGALHVGGLTAPRYCGS